VLKVLAGDDSGMTRLHLEQRLVDPFEAYPFDKSEAIDRAQKSMLAMMRYLADLWIDSGNSSDQASNNPADRHVAYAPPENQSTLVPPSGIPPTARIADLYNRFLRTEARWPEIRSDGTLNFKEVIFGMPFEYLALGHLDPNAPFDELGMKVAMYWFSRLLDSPYSRHLARCDNCRGYFAYERVPRTPRYFGVYCSDKCKPIGARRRAEESREQKRDLMFDAAAKAWKEWEPSRKWPKREDYVVSKVNKEYETAWKKKWVSQNLEEILRRVNGKVAVNGTVSAR
jgi:hypothetical protein